MRSPKLGGKSAQYYRYYAGYTQGFVEDMLQSLKMPKTGLIVDPWNGAGTTTAAASAAGQAAVGYDINPVAVLIGRARLLSSSAEVAGSLVPVAVQICENARAHPYTRSIEQDPLGTWFGPGTTREIRTLERAIYRVLVDETLVDDPPSSTDDLPHSSLAAVFYVALFRMVRNLAHQFVPSNPTWIKEPDGRRIGATRSHLQAAFVSAVRVSDPRESQLQLPLTGADSSVSVGLASSTNLPLGDGVAAAVVSSPPYLTRLDYVKATLPELSALGLTDDDVRALRDRMIGTPTMSGEADDANPELWGVKTKALIDVVEGHSSRASATYYKKYYVQYFDGMWQSLAELNRVLEPGGSAVLVVQDSYYKEVHVDLPSLIGDMSQTAGWQSWKRIDFEVPSTIAAINPGTRQYRKEFTAVESAVILRK